MTLEKKERKRLLWQVGVPKLLDRAFGALEIEHVREVLGATKCKVRGLREDFEKLNYAAGHFRENLKNIRTDLKNLSQDLRKDLDHLTRSVNKFARKISEGLSKVKFDTPFDKRGPILIVNYEKGTKCIGTYIGGRVPPDKFTIHRPPWVEGRVHVVWVALGENSRSLY